MLRPKLAASMLMWRAAWDAETRAAETRAKHVLLKAEEKKRAGVEGELLAVRAELERAKADAADGLAAAAAIAAEELAEAMRVQQVKAERELAERLDEATTMRVQHLQTVAVHRIGQQGLTRALGAWVDSHRRRKRQQNLLAAASGRMLRPKLAASLAVWHASWDVEVREKVAAEVADAKLAEATKQRGVQDQLKALEAETDKLKLERLAAAEERKSLFEKSQALIAEREMFEAEREASVTALKAAEKERAEQAKAAAANAESAREASAKLKQEESEALLQQLLADQRASFEDQLAAVRAELAVEQARPQLAAVPAAAAPAPVPNRER